MNLIHLGVIDSEVGAQEGDLNVEVGKSESNDEFSGDSKGLEKLCLALIKDGTLAGQLRPSWSQIRQITAKQSDAASIYLLVNDIFSKMPEGGLSFSVELTK